jgi:hypothetical protein
MKVHPTLTIQELQTIKLKHHNNNYINQIKFIKLLCDDCHKQAILISESHDDSNWCTPCRGKPDEHATRFRRPVRVWPSTICISHGPRITTFHVTVNRFEQIHWPQEGLLTQSTARQLTDPWVRTQLLSHNNQWSIWQKSSFCWRSATTLAGPIYQHAIGTFNTCSRGPTHQYLTDIDGGYNLGNASFPHHTPRSFQPAVSTFHLRAPLGL